MVPLDVIYLQRYGVVLIAESVRALGEGEEVLDQSNNVFGKIRQTVKKISLFSLER